MKMGVCQLNYSDGTLRNYNLSFRRLKQDLIGVMCLDCSCDRLVARHQAHRDLLANQLGDELRGSLLYNGFFFVSHDSITLQSSVTFLRACPHGPSGL